MSNLPRGNSEILQSWDQGKLLQKEGQKKAPWRECHHVLTTLSLNCQPSTTLLQTAPCPRSRAMSNLPRGSARSPAKLGPGQAPAKRRPEKTPWLRMPSCPKFFKCQPSTTFCCKPRLPKCPWSLAMSNLPRGPPARVF